MNGDIDKLKKELEKARSQLCIFYELTKAMRTTLHLEEITYIILTGLTAHEGLCFNRAVIFFVDENDNQIKGFMGIGPMDSKESGTIWYSIEKEKKDLYDLIDNYHHIKKNKTRAQEFINFIQSLTFSLTKESGLIFDILNSKSTLHITKNKINKLANDPLIKKLKLDEFLICPLWMQGKAAGAIIVDNCVTKKSISDDDIKIFNMFTEQAIGAIKNSKDFESTLTQAHTDSLTSLWNYGYFQYKLDEELVKSSSDKSALSIMMIDVDNFKQFNDTYGHIQGDNALKQISENIKENCRKIDILCRYGGDEFSLILPSNSKKEAVLLGERIRKSMEKKEILNYKFTVSIGISYFNNHSPDKLTLIKEADEALYEAKAKGKNKVILY